MIRVNKTTGYAVKVIVRLYLNKGRVTTTKEISEVEKIPHGMLMKVFRILNGAGIVISHQGRGGVSGGFTLRSDVKELTLYDVITAMEGGIRFSPFETHEEVAGQVFRAFENINDCIIEQFKQYSIAALLNKED